MIALPPKVLVVGAGAVGLRTAHELVRRGCRVALRAPVPPSDPSTCSMGAGGLWMPFRCDDPRVDRWALETLDELLLTTGQRQDLVERLPTVVLQSEATTVLPEWTRDHRLNFQTLSLGTGTSTSSRSRDRQSELLSTLRIPPVSELRAAGYSHCWLFSAPVVNAPVMVQHLLEQLQQNSNKQAVDVNVETGQYLESIPHLQETARKLDCHAVINCAGLGAGPLVRASNNNTHSSSSDDDVTGARGILLHYDRSSCVRRFAAPQQDALLMVDAAPWGTETEPCYMIPRGDKVLVGGSYLPGDMEGSIRPEERERLLENAYKLGIDTRQSQPIGEWTGFRPKRSAGVRCELDETTKSDSIPVFHNYGHGGSGWTINVGTAREIVNILMQTMRR